MRSPLIAGLEHDLLELRRPAVSPLEFENTFKVAPPQPQEGLYKLTATINHSPTADPAKLTEMFGFAESTPVDIRNAVVESDRAQPCPDSG